MQGWLFSVLLLWIICLINLPKELNASIQCYECDYVEVTDADGRGQKESSSAEDRLKLVEDQQGRRTSNDPSCKANPTTTCVGTAGCYVVTKVDANGGYWIRGCKKAGLPSSGCHPGYPGLSRVPCFCETDLCNDPSLDYHKNNNNNNNNGGNNNCPGPYCNNGGQAHSGQGTLTSFLAPLARHMHL